MNLARRAMILAAALALAACGGDEQGSDLPPPVAASVDEIVDVSPKFTRETVSVDGTLMPVGDEWFVLRGRRAVILVAPEPDAFDGEPRGGEATVLGVVEKLDRLQTAELERLRARGVGGAALRRALTADDLVHISADRVDVE